VTVAELRQLIPLRNLDEEELQAFSLSQEVETYGRGSVLFARGERDSSVLFLLTGKVRIKLKDEQGYLVEGGTARANFPLSHMDRHMATAVAVTDVELVRIPEGVMHKNFEARLEDDKILDPESWEVAARIRALPLFQAFCQHLVEDSLQLPTLSDLALRLRKAVEKENIGVAEAARIVEMDATIATKLVHMANSPLYHSSAPARNCLEAVNRLGLKATCSLVVTLCLKDAFKGCDRLIERKMQELWRENLQVSALSYVLAKENHWPDPEEALLMGLISDIGLVPFLVFAGQFPREHRPPQDINDICASIRGPASCYVLRKWNFPEELVNIPMLAEMWNYDSGPQLSLSDIVMLSKLHRQLEKGRMQDLPSINSLPACGKLLDGSLTAEYSLKVLHDARDHIRSILNTLQ